MKMPNHIRCFFAALAIFFFLLPSLRAQEIKQVREIRATSVKNQANSGTCWSFATVSFLESELLRTGKGEYNLSEMYTVRMAYITKAERYLRLQGNLNFGPGGQAHDVINVWRDFGIMPDGAYTGLTDGDSLHNHREIDAFLQAVMKTTVKDGATKEFPRWKNAANALLDTYLGSVPQEFEYKGKKYTPAGFARELGLDLDDYIEITSFTHHPFYSQFVLEVPDNWAAGSYYNVPLKDLMEIISNSIDQGYTVAWDGDVSDDKGFSKNNGVAAIEDESKEVTPGVRQKAFDDFSTTDDHLMQLTGTGTDADGKKYYLTKNSWGTTRGMDGYWWMSENFIRLKTIAIMVHKDAVPADIAKKMKLAGR